MARSQSPGGPSRRAFLRVAVGALLLVVTAVAATRIDIGRSRADERRTPRGYDGDGRSIDGVTPPAEARNLVVVVVDTMRWDGMLPRPGGTRMPNLARLAAEGVSFADASSPSPWTMPAVGSLLTGLLPSEHGNLDSRRPPSLPAAVTTYAEVLSRSFGYETLACVDSSWFGGPGAFLQGFGQTSSGFHLQGVEQALGDWARRRKADRPFFLLLHTYEAHEPYGAANHPWPRPAFDPSLSVEVPALPLAPWEMARLAFLDLARRDALSRKMGVAFVRNVVRYVGSGYSEEPRPELAEELRVAYETGLSWVDGHLQNTVERLEALGLLRNTLLVVTSDHGEGFGEHGHLGHGRQLYDELLRIPLVMKGPAPFRGGQVARGSVSLMDVMPTFLDWIGVPPIAGADGASMLPVLRGESPGRPVLAEENQNAENMQRPVEASLASVRSESWKYVLVHDRTAGTVAQELYDLEKDPGETHDLLAGRAAGPPLPPAFCRAIVDLRERASRIASMDAEVAQTPYGVSAAGTVSFVDLPGPCED